MLQVEVGRAKAFLPEVGSRNVGSWSERMSWALLARWVTPTLSMQAQVLSVLMWDPCHLCQNTVLCLEATRTPQWAEPRLHTCLWALRESILFCK